MQIDLERCELVDMNINGPHEPVIKDNISRISTKFYFNDAELSMSDRSEYECLN